MLNLFQRKPAGFVNVTSDELHTLMHQKSRFELVDVRSQGEYARGHLKGAKLIPLPELASRAGQLDPEKVTILYCASGSRSQRAARFLAEQGFGDVRNLQGGIARWGGEVVR